MTNEPQTDRLGRDYIQGPNPAPGGVIDPGDVVVPPYAGRTNGSNNNRRSFESLQRSLKGAAGENNGATASPAHEDPVRPDEVTDREPDRPKGVGKSYSKRGEDAIK